MRTDTFWIVPGANARIMKFFEISFIDGSFLDCFVDYAALTAKTTNDLHQRYDNPRFFMNDHS